MFSNLRQGGSVYVLHKNGNPYVEVGTIEQTSNMPIMGYYPSLSTYPIDITLRVGEKVTQYQRIPANMETAEVNDPNSGEVVMIACTKEGVNNELNSMRSKSVEIINSVDFHKQRITIIDKLFGQVNPEVAEKQAQAQEISELKAQLESMKEMLSQFGEKTSVKKKGE